MTGVRDELANNLAKLSNIDNQKTEVEKHLALEHRRLTITDDSEIQRQIRSRIRKLESVLYSLASSLKDRQGSKPSGHR